MFSNTLLSILAISAAAMAMPTASSTEVCSSNEVAACCDTTAVKGVVLGATCSVASLLNLSLLDSCGSSAVACCPTSVKQDGFINLNLDPDVECNIIQL